MFCNKCGNEISNDAKFCTKCGNKITIINKGNNVKNRTTISKNIIIVIIFIAVISVAFIEIIVNSNAKPVNMSDSSETYYIGDTINLGDFTVKLEKYKTKEKGDRIDDYSVVADQQWIAIFLKYTNVSGEEKLVNSNVRLINSNGEQLEQPTLYYNVWGGEHLDSSNLMNNGSKTGFLAFINTKKDKAENLSLQICSDSIFREKNTFNFKLKEKQ